MMKKVVIGILANVDAGKTTLSEGLLYMSGKIGKLGRVDNKDTYLDTYELEKERGITIFSKQAVFNLDGIQVTLMDTPGHVDFSAEMERTLQVLDYAILVISGADGVQGHTKTLWMLLNMYNIPTFIFVNKMDQYGISKGKLTSELKRELSNGCIEFLQDDIEVFYDQLAMSDEFMMENFIDKNYIENIHIKKAINKRKVFPCIFGSALKLEGIEELIQCITDYIMIPSYSDQFGAKTFKVSIDEQGNRLTHMKITGGTLKVKDVIKGDDWEDKINQIRIYSGHKFETVKEIEAGSICAVTGLRVAKPGIGLGKEKINFSPVLEPILFYRMLLPQDYDPRVMLPKLRQIEEEEPELQIVWDEKLQEIQVRIMGEVQLEILQSIILSRFDVLVEFDEGGIVYKETITNTVEGVGHFEPLRHYAEVHLLIEPNTRGCGMVYRNNCSDDVLNKNYQNLIMQHLKSKLHRGVLTGSEITDLIITLVSGKSNNKHTEGGDFEEATVRAVRQGLMEAKSILLEPYYSFSLKLPEKMIGRAMTDIDRMGGTCELAQTSDDMAVIVGSCPVSSMRNYQKEVISYTKGYGSLICNLKGYEPCVNSDKVIEQIGYNPKRDIDNPGSSVFCAQGSGFTVEWDEVKKYMHVEAYLQDKENMEKKTSRSQYNYTKNNYITNEEINYIFDKTFYANQGKKSIWKNKNSVSKKYNNESFTHSNVSQTIKEEYLLVDGYNIIYAWPELNELVHHMETARMKLIDILSNYQSIRKCRIIIVFDAYRVQGYREGIINYNNIQLIFTKEAQTADHYIEKFAYDNNKKFNITVATSDGLEQIIVRGHGCHLLSANELKVEIEESNKKIMKQYQNVQVNNRNTLRKILSESSKEVLDEVKDRGKGKESN
jgi:ribosomal protection tetracycline resistance protein